MDIEQDPLGRRDLVANRLDRMVVGGLAGIVEADRGKARIIEFSPEVGAGELLKQAVGHCYYERIALLSADHRKSDAGVATGRLDHRLAGLENAGQLGGFDHVESEPILDR